MTDTQKIKTIMKDSVILKIQKQNIKIQFNF